MQRFLFVILLCVITGATASHAQSSLVYNRLRMIIAGKADEVRKELPDLMKEFPDEPGIMFLNGVLTDDGAKAVEIYEQITREHPQSEWADDAQLRVVQYYALKKDTVRAQRELANFKRNYPLSEFLIHAIELVKTTVGTGNSLSTRAASATEKVVTPTKGSKESSLLVESHPVAKSTEAAKSQPELKTEPQVLSDAPKKKYWGLQVGLYTSRKAADAEAQKYKDQRMKVDVVNKDNKFSVVVGNYSTKDSAEKSKDVIQKLCDCTPYVVEKY